MGSEDCKNLLYDQACLQVWAENVSNISLWMQTKECYKVSKKLTVIVVIVKRII